LKDAIDQALDGGQLPQKPQREPEDMLAEIIDILRHMERTGQYPGSSIHTAYGQVDSPDELSKSAV
jgi:hypothetical protein